MLEACAREAHSDLFGTVRILKRVADRKALTRFIWDLAFLGRGMPAAVFG
jgi:hypothetical protein